MQAFIKLLAKVVILQLFYVLNFADLIKILNLNFVIATFYVKQEKY